MAEQIGEQQMEERIRKVLEEKINPALSEHLGAAVFTGIDADGVVNIKLTGACGGCPASAETFEYVVKKHILEACPEVKDVALDTSVSEELLDMARAILNRGVRPE